MNVHISYKLHKTPDIEKHVNQFVQKLRKRLQTFRPELVHLKAIVEQNSAREGTTVSLNLRLPSGQMAAQESAQRPTAAIKSAFDELLHQVNKHKDQLRSSHKWLRWRDAANGRSRREVPFENTLASVHPPMVSSDDVRYYVNSNLARLERFVERELFFREAAEQIAANSIAAEEVVDEVIARALGSASEKPERISLEPWLYRLAIQAIDDLALDGNVNAEGVHLEESVRKQNVRASDEAELQFHQPDEIFTEETIIPDRRVSTPEDIAYSDEMLARVQVALGSAERHVREAFILHALEGFSVEEVATITDRASVSVELSIAAAREHLNRSPSTANRFRDKLLQKTGTA